MMATQGLEIGPAMDALARLGVFADDVVGVDLMFRVCISRGGRAPMLSQGLLRIEGHTPQSLWIG